MVETGATTTGARSKPTRMRVVADPTRAFAAVKVTSYEPVCVAVGVHVSRPVCRSEPATKLAPGGRPEATSDWIGSPSGSWTVTSTVSGPPGNPWALAGAATIGAPGTSGGPFTSRTVIAVVVEPLRPFVAVKVTFQFPACV